MQTLLAHDDGDQRCGDRAQRRASAHPDSVRRSHRSVVRAVEESLAVYRTTREEADAVLHDAKMDLDVTETLRELEGEMVVAAEALQFEKAALLRDQIQELKRLADGGKPGDKPVSYKKSKRARR